MAHSRVEILLVEDNPDDAELTLRTLRKNKVANHVLVLADGQAAIDYLIGDGSDVEGPGAELPRVIMLDLKLPKVDGIEVLRRIRGDDRTKLIPVVVLTSSNQESDLVRTYELGVNSYIVKPVDFSQFAATVRDVGLYWLLLNHPPG
jgi:two-component system, response regulator